MGIAEAAAVSDMLYYSGSVADIPVASLLLPRDYGSGVNNITGISSAAAVPVSSSVFDHTSFTKYESELTGNSTVVSSSELL